MTGKCLTCGHPGSRHTAISAVASECRAKIGLTATTCDCTRYLVESTPLKARKDDPTRRRFAAQRNKPYTDWVRQKPCLIGNRDCWHPRELAAVGILSDPAHVNETRAQGAPDEGEVVNLCRFHHREQEGRTPEFNRAYDVNLASEARALWPAYEKETGVPAL